MKAMKILSQALKVEFVLLILAAVWLFGFWLFTESFSFVQAMIVVATSIWIVTLVVRVFRSQKSLSPMSSLMVICVFFLLGLILATPQFLSLRQEGRLDLSNEISLLFGMGMLLINLILGGVWLFLKFFARSSSI